MNCDCCGIEFRIPTYLAAPFPNSPCAELHLCKEMDFPKYRQAGLVPAGGKAKTFPKFFFTSRRSVAILFRLFVEVEFSTENIGEFGNCVVGEVGVLNKIL